MDALLRSYQGMSFPDVMKLTLPQIILLNHSASVNRERAEEFYEWKQSHEPKKDKSRQKTSAPPEGSSKTEVFEGKTVAELDSDSFNRYFWSSGMGVR